MIRQFLSRRDAQRCIKAISDQIELLLSQQDWQSPVGRDGIISDVRYSVLSTLKEGKGYLPHAESLCPEEIALSLIIQDIQHKLTLDKYMLYGNVVTAEGSELRRLLRHVLGLASLRGYRVALE